MMAEALIKNPVCAKCGEVARPKALFCFACGGEIVEAGSEKSVSSAWFREDLTNESAAESDPSDDVEASDIESRTENPLEFDESDVAPEEPVVEEPAVKQKTGNVSPRKAEISRKSQKLTSAADLRTRPKPVHSKRIEVVWEEKSDSPNFLFVAGGFALVLLAVIIFFASLYLK